MHDIETTTYFIYMNQQTNGRSRAMILAA